MKVVPIDIYDSSGNLSSIEFHSLEGEFMFQAVWDPSDDQTNDNRNIFRKWSKTMAKRLDFEVEL